MLTFFIGLRVSDEPPVSLKREWYETVRENAPRGVVCLVPNPGNPEAPAIMIARKDTEGFSYLIPLTRHLTCDEAEVVVKSFAIEHQDMDFDVIASTNEADPLEKVAQVDQDALLAFATMLAKKEHDAWMADRLADGWRYGVNVSAREKTHPLLRPWEQLPPKFRKIDMDKPQMLVDLLGDQGYTVVAKSDLEMARRLGLTEDVVADAAVADKAAQAYRAIAKADFALEVEVGGVGEFAGAKASSIGLDKALGVDDFAVLVGHRKTNTVGVSGGFYELHGDIDGAKLAILIHAIQASDEVNADTAKKAVNSVNAMATFKHEFVHMLDLLRGIRGKAASPKDGETDYINHPIEFNARWHDIADAWLSALNEIETAAPEDRADIADIYGIKGDFKADFTRLVKGADQHGRQFWKNLTPERRKRTISRLANVHAEIVKKLGG